MWGKKFPLWSFSCLRYLKWLWQSTFMPCFAHFCYIWTLTHMHIIGQIYWRVILFLRILPLGESGLQFCRHQPSLLSVSSTVRLVFHPPPYRCRSCNAPVWGKRLPVILVEQVKGLLCQDHWHEWVSERGPVQWHVSHMRTWDHSERNDGYARWIVQKVWNLLTETLSL